MSTTLDNESGSSRRTTTVYDTPFGRLKVQAPPPDNTAPPKLEVEAHYVLEAVLPAMIYGVARVCEKITHRGVKRAMETFLNSQHLPSDPIRRFHLEEFFLAYIRLAALHIDTAPETRADVMRLLRGSRLEDDQGRLGLPDLWYREPRAVQYSKMKGKKKSPKARAAAARKQDATCAAEGEEIAQNGADDAPFLAEGI